jgi:hypothetical protein
MVPNPLFYQLVLVALILICLLLHVWWPDNPPCVAKAPLKPDRPRSKRAKEPKPFTGYIHKPLCEACAASTNPRPPALGSPPPIITFARGRKRTIDTSGHFCPIPDCAYHGWLGRGNIRSNGHPGGQPWWQFQCVSCQGSRLGGFLPPDSQERKIAAKGGQPRSRKNTCCRLLRCQRPSVKAW